MPADIMETQRKALRREAAAIVRAAVDRLAFAGVEGGARPRFEAWLAELVASALIEGFRRGRASLRRGTPHS